MRQAEEVVVQEAGLTFEQHAVRQTISDLEDEMLVCASSLQFERAALLRDEIQNLREKSGIAEEPKKPAFKKRHGPRLRK